KDQVKVYVSVDMEGIWGVVHGDQTSPAGGGYGAARKWMAQDVNAAIVGLFAAGATEVVVNDAHGGQRNILADELDPRASLITGSPKPLSMMEGIDATYDACLLIGYHARAGSAPAVLDHTISGSVVFAIRVNGLEMPELGLNAAIAGAYGVPVVMLSGDGTTCRQAAEVLGPGLKTAAVKEAAWRAAAKLLPRGDALAAIQNAARDGLLERGKIKPYKLSPPFTFELEFHRSSQAELASLIPGVKRPSARVVSFASQDYLEGFKLLRALIALASTD
ncbi:MAG: M55 family metallopeptidase, partial [Candidatus Aminicenantes bacterium]|nr:M55 family metallopeptidase [Candidatus Aminicenantes bacterium]